MNGYGGAHDPRVITTIAGPAAHIGSLDLLFVARGRGNARGGTLVPRPDLLNHPRVKYAASFKDDLDVFGFDDAARSAVVILGRGVARLSELSIELEADRPGRGEGSALAAAALAHLPRGSLVVACVASCDAASVGRFLHAGSSVGSFAVSAA